MGLLLGVIGVSLWILYYAGITTLYPGVSHAPLMIEGIIASFVIGFLGTAGPRLVKAPHFTRAELLTLLTLDLLVAGLHLGGANRAGDVAFGLCVAFFLFESQNRLTFVVLTSACQINRGRWFAQLQSKTEPRRRLLFIME